MATKTFEELKQLAIQIRDEKTNKANTATRIGTQMIEHLNKLEQEYYNKDDVAEQLKTRDDELARLDKMTTEYNVSVLHPTSGSGGSNKYTLETAIAQVPSKYRSVGIKCAFVNENGEGECWEYKVGSWNWNVNGFVQVGSAKLTELGKSFGEILVNKTIKSNQRIISKEDLILNTTIYVTANELKNKIIQLHKIDGSVSNFGPFQDSEPKTKEYTIDDDFDYLQALWGDITVSINTNYSNLELLKSNQNIKKDIENLVPKDSFNTLSEKVSESDIINLLDNKENGFYSTTANVGEQANVQSFGFGDNTYIKAKLSVLAGDTFYVKGEQDTTTRVVWFLVDNDGILRQKGESKIYDVKSINIEYDGELYYSVIYALIQRQRDVIAYIVRPNVNRLLPVNGSSKGVYQYKKFESSYNLKIVEFDGIETTYKKWLYDNYITVKRITIATQEEFNNLTNLINEAIEGDAIDNRIIINIKKGNYFYKDNHLDLTKIPKLGCLSIIGEKGTVLMPELIEFSQNNENTLIQDDRFVLPFVDNEDNPLSFLNESNGVVSMFFDASYQRINIFDELLISKQESTEEKGVVRFKVPDNYNEGSYDSSYVIFLYWWLGNIAKVQKIENGYLYCKNIIGSATSDKIIGINLNSELHVNGGKIYIPLKYDKVYYCKNNTFILASKDYTSTIEFIGIEFNAGYSLLNISDENTKLRFKQISFKNSIRSILTNIYAQGEIWLEDSQINTTYRSFLAAHKMKVYVTKNRFKEVGIAFYDTETGGACQAITTNKAGSYVAHNSFLNVLECCALNNGNDAVEKTICEHNKIIYSSDFITNCRVAQSDNGAIYYAGKNVIIRDNLIMMPPINPIFYGIAGVHAIHADNGASQSAIYRNLIIGSFDRTVSVRVYRWQGADSANLSLDNFIGFNIITSRYEFTVNTKDENGCIKAANFIGSKDNNLSKNIEFYEEDYILQNIDIKDDKVYIPRVYIDDILALNFSRCILSNLVFI